MTSATAAPQIKCDATRSRYRLFMAFGLVFALVAALVALALGRFHLTLAQTAATLISPWLDESSVTPAMQSVIFNVRLPRVLLALAAGAGLAAAGAAFQSLFFQSPCHARHPGRCDGLGLRRRTGASAGA